jgi:hypothetical protein
MKKQNMSGLTGPNIPVLRYQEVLQNQCETIYWGLRTGSSLMRRHSGQNRKRKTPPLGQCQRKWRHCDQKKEDDKKVFNKFCLKCTIARIKEDDDTAGSK